MTVTGEDRHDDVIRRFPSGPVPGRPGGADLARHVEVAGTRSHGLAEEYARAYEERLIEGVCMPRASSAYFAILDYLREIVRHARRGAERVTVAD